MKILSFVKTMILKKYQSGWCIFEVDVCQFILSKYNY